MELRVLSGPQAGCRLPLGASTYRAGGGDTCDIVLEGLPEDQVAFVIYVGQRAIGLEALSDQVRVAGRPVAQLISLASGQIFEFGQWLFAVDDPQAPWPKDPRADNQANAVASQAPSDHDENVLTAMSADRALSNTISADSNEGSRSASRDEAATAVAAVAKRRKLPFWVIGLAATAAFLVGGVLVLMISLAPTASNAAVQPPPPIAEQLASLVAKAGGEVKLDRLDADSFRLTGNVATRAEKVSLTRDARALAPNITIQLNADEDLEALVRDALSLFPQSGVEMESLRAGRLALVGAVKETRVREQIVAALWDGVPGLKSIDAQVLASDEVLSEFAGQLARSGLAGRVTGAFDAASANQFVVQGTVDDASRAVWATVREQLQTRFGARLEIIEKFHAPGTVAQPVKATDSDVVAVVRGPIPYALLRDGSKRPLSVPHGR